MSNVYLYVFAKVLENVHNIVGVLDDSTITRFPVWFEKLGNFLRKMKETSGWAYDTKSSFERKENIFEIENMILDRLVLHGVARIFMTRVSESEDRLTCLQVWYYKSTYVGLYKQEADEYCQQKEPILIYYAEKVKRLKEAYKVELAEGKVTDAMLCAKVIDGLDKDAEAVGYGVFKGLAELLPLVENISFSQSKREARINSQTLQLTNIELERQVKELKLNVVEKEKGAGKWKEDFNRKEVRQDSNRKEVKQDFHRKGGAKRDEVLCRECQKSPPEAGFNYCQDCYSRFKERMKLKKVHKKKPGSGRLNAAEDSVEEVDLHAVSIEEGMNAVLINNDKSKYLSSDCELVGKDGVLVKLLVMWDTGASVSFGDGRIPYIGFKPKIMKVRYANGSSEMSSRMGLVRLLLDGKVVEHWVHLVRSLPTPLIIGMDFLRGRAVIDLVKGMVTFHG